MPTVLDWNPAVDSSELIRTIREAVIAGTSVILPGDCGYVVLLNPASATSAARLDVLKTPPAVLSWGSDDLTGLGLRLSTPMRRLVSRGWPAPLVVAVPETPDWPAHWSSEVRTRLAAGAARFRCPEHPLFEAIVPALEMPLLVVDTFLPTAEAVLDLLDDEISVAVSAGIRPVREKPTLVTATASGYEITEAGRLSAEEVEKLTARIVLFVCTGNTCRSPLAEAIAKRLLADRLACAVEDLPRRGVWILSAGVSAFGEAPATTEAVAVANEFGAHLSEHASRAVSAQLLAAADDVIAMTHGHAQALASRFPNIGPPPRLLCGDADLDDPIGAGLEVYRECARTIRTHLEKLILEWLGP
jgi:protein-tyrosine phosphatase